MADFKCGQQQVGLKQESILLQLMIMLCILDIQNRCTLIYNYLNQFLM